MSLKTGTLLEIVQLFSSCFR